MMQEDVQTIQRVLVERLAYLRTEGGTGPGGLNEPPEFNLFARDYLEYAEGELRSPTGLSRLNCVSHLKRAMDCQLETFLHYFGLRELFRKRNLGFDRKLEFLKAAGVFS